MRSSEDVNNILRRFVHDIKPSNLKRGTFTAADIDEILLEVTAITRMLDDFPEGSVQYESIHFVLRSFCDLGYVVVLNQAKLIPVARPLIEKCVIVSTDLGRRRTLSQKARFGESWGF